MKSLMMVMEIHMFSHFEIVQALCTTPRALDYAEFELTRCVSFETTDECVRLAGNRKL